MKHVIIALLVALAPLVGFADATVYNCPKHGPCTQDQIIKTGEGMNRATYCKKCFAEKKAQEKKRKEEEAEKERQRKLVSGNITELDILDGMTINARCLNTNTVVMRILPEINRVYGKTPNGIVVRSRYAGKDIKELTMDDFKDFLLKGGVFQISFLHKIKPYKKLVGGTLVERAPVRDSWGRSVGWMAKGPPVVVGGHYETIDTRTDTIKISLKLGVIVRFQEGFVSQL